MGYEQMITPQCSQLAYKETTKTIDLKNDT